MDVSEWRTMSMTQKWINLYKEAGYEDAEQRALKDELIIKRALNKTRRDVEEELDGRKKGYACHINFPNHYNDEKIKKVINTILDKPWKWLNNEWCFCIEFYSGDDLHWNPHIHMWIRKVTGVKPSDIKWAILRKFKKELRVECDYDHDNLLPYIEGNKITSKLEGVVKDKEYRQKNNYKEIYKSC